MRWSSQRCACTKHVRAKHLSHVVRTFCRFTDEGAPGVGHMLNRRASPNRRCRARSQLVRRFISRVGDSRNDKRRMSRVRRRKLLPMATLFGVMRAGDAPMTQL